MRPRHAVLPTPPRSSHPRCLLYRQHLACVSPLAATLMHPLASVANKRLTAWLNPLDATLTKNRGAHPSSQILPSILTPSPVPVPTSHSPYTLPSSVSRKSFICHSYENCRGVYQQFPFWNSSPATRHPPPLFFSTSGSCRLHSLVVRAAAAFRDHPINNLIRIGDIARLAMHAIRGA